MGGCGTGNGLEPSELPFTARTKVSGETRGSHRQRDVGWAVEAWVRAAGRRREQRSSSRAVTRAGQRYQTTPSQGVCDNTCMLAIHVSVSMAMRRLRGKSRRIDDAFMSRSCMKTLIYINSRPRAVNCRRKNHTMRRMCSSSPDMTFVTCQIAQSKLIHRSFPNMPWENPVELSIAPALWIRPSAHRPFPISVYAKAAVTEKRSPPIGHLPSPSTRLQRLRSSSVE